MDSFYPFGHIIHSYITGTESVGYGDYTDLLW